jgi:hypothetical protein
MKADRGSPASFSRCLKSRQRLQGWIGIRHALFNLDVSLFQPLLTLSLCLEDMAKSATLQGAYTPGLPLFGAVRKYRNKDTLLTGKPIFLMH